MTSNAIAFSNDETHIYMYTTGHSSGRVGYKLVEGTDHKLSTQGDKQ